MTEPRDSVIPLYRFMYEEVVRRALAEDLGRAGDITTDAVVPPSETAVALLIARASGRIAGLEVAGCAFTFLDAGIRTEWRSSDGSDAAAGEVLAVIRGPARPILTAERTALNMLSHLSGIATCTRDIACSVKGQKCRVICTRKTTPGLRLLEKYAVRAGGGANHRFGLDDGVLIKDNHRAIAGSLTEAVHRVRGRVGHMVKIEVEVDSLEQLEEALRLEVDAVLLDNMTVEQLTQAVRMVGGKLLTEASGGITPATAPEIAATGIDLLSVGWITHSAPALDVALDVAARV
jgi:nicotinate-nucleotide pyrophosphorylase (carboxylating)